ncbi:MAG TPA: hypothetical protein VFF77_01575 [Holophagaceae bacterium]|jgi:hypothetical protein|nr:hypothetical protein [Holophagaceae bacterium]
MRPAALALILLAPALQADGLTDLRAALKNLAGTQAVKATVDCQVWNRSGEGKKAKVSQGRAQARVEDGPSGLKLGWDKAALDRVEAAAKAKDKGPKQAMDALSAEKARDLLDAAKDLLGDLDGAEVLEDRADSWQGRPARLLSFKLDGKDMDEDDRKHLKSFSHTLKVWMGADGAPLGLSEQLDMKMSVMFISVEVHHKAARTFLRSGDRLVTVHDESEDSGSGAGEHGEQKTVMDLKL